MLVKALASDSVCIEQVGGWKRMPAFMWTEAVAERDTLRQRLAAAEAANKRLEDKNNWLHGALAQAQATAERLENRLALLGAIEDEAAKGGRE